LKFWMWVDIGFAMNWTGIAAEGFEDTNSIAWEPQLYKQESFFKS
jgi:hypothetical protein